MRPVRPARPVMSERDGRVAGPLSALLPGGRLRPGTAVSVGGDLPLLLALAAGAAPAGEGWAAVGLPRLGALAAADAGLEPDAGIWVDLPGRQWPQVVATALEAVPVVLVGALGPVPDRIGRRLAAVGRRSGSVLLAADAWAGAELRLRVTAAAWEGVGPGHGVLRGRRARVVAAGRGAAGRARQAELWLPGPDGTVRPMTEQAAPGVAAAAVAGTAADAGGGRSGLGVVG
jgi:hypothetical protein